MRNENIPVNAELPSMSKLIKSTVLAIVIAALLLVTVVLPAEYGLDPTGVGEAIGLLKMGKIKVSLAEEAAADRVAAEVPESNIVDQPKAVSGGDVVEPSSDGRSDERTFSLSPNQGLEIKLTMAKGERVNYVWWTDGGRANFDTHADSKELKINYHGYEKGSLQRSEGELVAAFDGKHGWFWRNRTSKTMTVTLQVSGEYSSIDQMN